MKASENNPTIKITQDTESQGALDNMQSNKKLDIPMELLDNGNEESQSGYQIRPQLTEKFKPQVVKELIHNVLHDQLSSKVYNVDDAKKWTKTIADLIRNKVKELNFKEYKYIVNVVLGEQKGAGVKVGNRCLWDAEADDYAYADFTNVIQYPLLFPCDRCSSNYEYFSPKTII